jgi:hypothetical protein
MPPPNSEKNKNRAGIATVVTGLALFVNAVSELIEVIGKAPTATGEVIEAWQSLGLWVGLCARFSKSSRLLKVEALRIDPDNPAHLIGRGEKIEQLEHLCRDSFLVNLVGRANAN